MSATLCPREVDFDKLAKLILDTVREMVVGTQLKRRDFFSLYQDVYAICTARPHPLNDRIHEAMTTFFREHLEGVREVGTSVQHPLSVP